MWSVISLILDKKWKFGYLVPESLFVPTCENEP